MVTNTSIADELAIDKMPLDDKIPLDDNMPLDDKTPINGKIPLDNKTSPSEPPTFLSLARELRKKILAQTYDLEMDVHEWGWSVSGTRKDIGNWASILCKVDSNIFYREDIDFVEAQWLKELDKMRRAIEQDQEMD